MSRRSLISIGAVIVGLLVLVAWLLWPEPAAPGAGAQLRSAASPVTLAPPELPTPAERGEPEPASAVPEIAATVESSRPAAPAADLRPLKQIDVGVIQPSGEPLSAWLQENLRELDWLHAVATTEPLGERLPDSIAPFYAWMGLGTFDRPHYGNSNQNPTVPGFIRTVTLPHAMPVCINLAVGPIVLGAQRLGENDDTAVFVVDATAVSRHAGSLRVSILSSETRQPIEGAVIKVGRNSNLRPGDNGQTDDLGVCEVHELAPGPTQLWVSAAGFEQRGLDLTILPGDKLDLGLIELQPATRVSGRVVFSTGEVVPRPVVWACVDDGGFRSGGLSAPSAVARGEDGMFTFGQLGRRRYGLAVITHADGDDSYGGVRMAFAEVDTTEGPISGLLMTVDRAPAVTFLNPAGREGVSIHVRGENAAFFDWWHDVPYLASPDSMKFCLLPGRYVVEFAVPGQPPQTRPLVVGAEPMDFDLSR